MSRYHDFQGQFTLGVDTFITEEPTSKVGHTTYKVGVFNMSQAEAIFVQGINPGMLTVYAIREDEMKVCIVQNMYEAKLFFEGDLK